MIKIFISQSNARYKQKIFIIKISKTIDKAVNYINKV